MAEDLVAQLIKRTNLFFNGKWKAYQQQVDNTPLKNFTDFKTIE